MAVTENVSAQTEGPLPAMDHPGRIERLRTMLAEARLDALLVTNLTNIRYLCGFSGSAAMLLVTDSDLVFVTDGRYTEQSSQELAVAGVEARVNISAESDRTVAQMATGLGVNHLGLEETSMTWAEYTRWNDVLFADGQLLRSESMVERLRMVKEPAEAVRIRTACDIADRALDHTRGLLDERPTEVQFAMELDATMKRMGAADVSFETIVASGPNGAKPHHRPGNRTISDGDLVVIDFGALIDGYHSDMTRTVAVGDIGDERRRMLDVVLASQQAGVEAVRSGADAAGVDSVCREVIAEAGWADAFVHGTGHGVGLDIHEEPRVSSRSTAILEPGHVVTVEPGIYLPDLGGVRIEDTVLVTDAGCDRLTRAPKDPYSD